MNIKDAKLAALGVAIAAGVAMSMMTPAVAGQKSDTDPVVAASAAAPGSKVLATQMSNEGYKAMRDISGARIAIFNGKPGLAKRLVASAARLLKVVDKDDTKYIMSKKLAITGSAADKLVPINGSLYVDDNFTATPEKAKKLAEANKHLKAGENKKAIEILKLASIDVSMRRILMPVGHTIEDVKAATDLLGKGQFYQANLALKAAINGLSVDTVSVVQP